MAMLRNSRTILLRLTIARNVLAPAPIAAPGTHVPSVSIGDRSHFSSFPSSAAWRSLIFPSAFNALLPVPVGPKIFNRSYAKRPKKWQGVPHAFVQVEPGVPVPPYQPNAGSVKNRKHKKRMAQRDAFAKAQSQRRKAQTKAAVILRDAARRKRWREGAARARAWADQLAKSSTGPLTHRINA